jgi:hypothetical protein
MISSFHQDWPDIGPYDLDPIDPEPDQDCSDQIWEECLTAAERNPSLHNK